MTDHPLRLTSHRTNWLKYKKYVSSHVKLTPHFNIEADFDCSTDTLEEVFVKAATISTQQGRDVQSNHFKANLQIERLDLEKRRLRRAWQTNRSPSTKQRLKEAIRTLNRALKQETESKKQKMHNCTFANQYKTSSVEGSPKSELSNRNSHSDKKFIWQLDPQRRR